jgi:riboflavin biosynthesis pyrimidine reductase
MMSTIDGRIIVENWGARNKVKEYSGIYEKCHESFRSQAWMVGRVTMEKDFTEGKKPRLTKSGRPFSREVFVGDEKATSFAIAVDTKGKLGWESNEIDGDHIIELLSGQVSNAYLHYLQQKGISYIVAGKKEVDFAQALKQLSKFFPIQTIMLEGGGHINGALLSEGLIDEISLLIIPVADGTSKSPTTFEITENLQKRKAQQLQLAQVKKMKGGVLWLKYRSI